VYISSLRLLLVVWICFVPGFAMACTCGTGASFSAVAPKAPVLAHARVLQHDKETPNGTFVRMTIEVIDPIRGAAKAEKLIVWGENYGSSCRPYVSSFPVNSEWLFVIEPELIPRQNELQLRQFTIGPCGGAYWLKVENGYVYGRIFQADKNSEMKLAKLMRRFRK